MVMTDMTARDIGVQALDLVGEAHFLKEIQSPIHGGGLCRAFPNKVVEQVISFRWLFAFQQEGQDLSADRREFLPFRTHHLFCFRQKGFSVSRAAGCIGVIMCVRMGHSVHFE